MEMERQQRNNSGVMIYLLFLACLMGLTSPTFASNGLPGKMAAYRGSFVQDDVFGNNCVNVNGHTDSCTCPGGTAPTKAFRVFTDFAGAGTASGGKLQVCTADNSTASEYAGGYQLDNPGTGSLGCRVANGATGACSCPVGTNSVQSLVLADGSTGTLVQSKIVMCMKAVTTPVAFGGAFQKNDVNVCTATNPYTGACSCPANFYLQAHRAEIPGSGGGLGGGNIYTCIPAAETVQLCAGQTADPTGRIPASAAIQACINATPTGGALVLPAGTFLIDSHLNIAKAMTLKTNGTTESVEKCGKSVPCATFFASPALFAPFGILDTTTGTPNVIVDHIILDGNRHKRTGTPSYSQCITVGANNTYGYNAQFQACDDCKFTNSVSKRTLCGTALTFTGKRGIVRNSTFDENGDNTTSGGYADGLTIGSDGAKIENNTFSNNTDVGLILGRGAAADGVGVGATVTNNTIVQDKMYAYAAFMLHNFSNTNTGDFTGATMSGNTITCAPGKCFFAANLGAHAWDQIDGQPYVSNAVFGGVFSGNSISGGVITLNVDGVGTPTKTMDISNNNLGPYRTPTTASCGVRKPGRYIMNVRYSKSTDSYITGNQGSPDYAQDTHFCNGD